MFGRLDSRIVLITGERQVGKSTALRYAVTELRRTGLHVSGLLTRRTGPHDLEVTEIHAGSSYALTDPFRRDHTSPTRNFAMNPDALLRSSKAMAAGFPTELFILDELGPLELVHRQGWVGVFELLHHETYGLAYIVIRPDLLGAATAELPGTSFGLIRLTLANRDAIPAELVRLALVANAQLRKGNTGSAVSAHKEGSS
jgi:nucleoside-triphosphatase THEP1